MIFAMIYDGCSAFRSSLAWVFLVPLVPLVVNALDFLIPLLFVYDIHQFLTVHVAMQVVDKQLHRSRPHELR